jgi:hypothetical protein
MWRKGWKWTIFTLVLALAMVWTPALAIEAAEPAPGSGPEVPMGQAEEWTLLEPGMTAWHAFFFNQPHAMRTGETADVGTTTVRMESVPKEVGKFEVLSQKEVALWAKAEKYVPIGEGTLSCGCKAEDLPRKLSWTGVPAPHALNYIKVSNPTDKALYYRLLVDDNKYVSYPAPIMPAVAVVPAAAPAAAVPAAAPAVAAAVPAVGNWFNLQPGQEMWFSFAYDATTGVKHDKDPESIDLTLFAEEKHPLDRISFDVFTDAEYQQLVANGEDITGKDIRKGTAVGCGTDNGTMRGDLNWEGHFENSQTLHVRVRLGTGYLDGLNVMLEALGKTLQQM